MTTHNAQASNLKASDEVAKVAQFLQPLFWQNV